MARGRTESSRAAEAVEQRLVRGDDALDRRRLGLGLPLVELERAAEEDAVGAREHIARLALERVADLGLRKQDGELAADGVKRLVPEKLAGAEAGAVEDEPLRKRRDLRGSCELADLDPPAGDLHVPRQLAKEASDLDIQGVVAEQML